MTSHFQRLISALIVFACTMPTLAGSNPLSPEANTIRNTVAEKILLQRSKGLKSNHLIQEKSPYLLQHAYNPIDWFPWSDEAFSLAKAQNKLIFLSIGYSTCHWCHVMAKECFENPEIADFLNKHFICIKVDREERPDIDQIYMQATLALNGSGGWPMSVFLLPDLKPFFAGTYFPPESRPGRPGFLEIATLINKAWSENPEKIKQAAGEIAASLNKTNNVRQTATQPPDKIFARGLQQLIAQYDQVYGGFGQAPKFPSAATALFLFRYYNRYHDDQALTMAITTLKKMANGGIYDQLGGGFHRYAVDSQWHTPHFEKMLYDQAELSIAYLEAFQITGQAPFATTARSILDYVLKDMTSPDGGFYSAEDADSVSPENKELHGEGFFYTWTEKELLEILDKESYELVRFHLGITLKGNAVSDPFGELSGRNIPYIARSQENTARIFNKPESELSSTINNIRQKLLTARNKRPRPHLDDKIITAWNGLMISAFAKGYQVLDDHRYITAAQNAANFVKKALYKTDTQKLSRRFRDGTAGIDGFLVDYAFLIQGLLDLFESSFDPEWLELAIRLTQTQIALFNDPDGGGFFDTSGTDSALTARIKSDYDAAEPSGNSIAALNLYRLSQITGIPKWRELADATITAFNSRIADKPLAMQQMLIALDFQMDKPKQIIIAGSKDSVDTKQMLREIHKIFMPGKIILLADGGENQKKLIKYLPYLAFIEPVPGKSTAYVCKNYTCQLPTTDIKEMLRQLEN